MHIREGLDKDAFASLRDQVEFTITPEGLRIDLMDKDDSTFFDSGSASLHGETEHILGVIAHELGSLDHQVDLEGHTDSRGYAATDKLFELGTVGRPRECCASRDGARRTASIAGDERERSCGSSASIPGRSVRRTKSTRLDPGEESSSQSSGRRLRGVVDGSKASAVGNRSDPTGRAGALTRPITCRPWCPASARPQRRGPRRPQTTYTNDFLQAVSDLTSHSWRRIGQGS